MIDDVANDALDALSSCQCCLLGGQQRSLKTPYIFKRKAEIYSDMLRECFDIRLNLGSEKSGICLVCVDRLRDASSFKQQVQRSQLELRRRLTRALGIRDEEPAAIVDLEISDKEITSSKPDDVAPVELTDADSDVVICEENDVKSEQIEEVETKDNSSALEETAAVAKLEISDDEEDETNDNLPDEDALVKLEESDDSSSDGDLISPSWSASMCARAKDQLAMTCSVRLDRLQDDEAPPACQICHMTFDHESNLATHMTGMHGDDENHIHTGDNNAHIYDICKKQFMVGDLKRHVTYYTKKKRFICELCNKSFSTKSHLRRHFIIHTGQRPFECEICYKRFNQKCNFESHLKLHTGESPFKGFKCEICNKQFSTNYKLKTHIMLHTGEKPFCCNICNKQFALKSYLTLHIKRHGLS